MKYLILILALLTSQIASARIGETLEECDKRYGEPKIYSFSKMARSYLVDGMKIYTQYHNGICTYIKYESNAKGNMYKSEAERILHSYYNGEWEPQEVRGVTGSAVWLRYFVAGNKRMFDQASFWPDPGFLGINRITPDILDHNNKAAKERLKERREAERKRVFTSADGRRLIGELVKVGADTVTIIRFKDKKSFTISKTGFISQDQAYFEIWKPSSSPETADNIRLHPPNIVGDKIEELISRLRKKYKIRFYYKRFPKTTWEINYSLARETDYAELYEYIIKFDEEFHKYPKDFHKKCKLKSVVFTTNLSIGNQRRGAIPDYKEEILILDFRPPRGGDMYKSHVIHHEFYHLIEEEFNNSPYWKDPHWRQLNAPSISYGNGGKYVRDGGAWHFVHPERGFVNRYAMSAIEEDKAEIFAALFIKEHHDKLARWSLEDNVLLAKMKYMKSFLKKIDPRFTDRYWNDLER
jgi:hypothetical protein